VKAIKNLVKTEEEIEMMENGGWLMEDV